jgi:prepilin-type N-terminal cleavage/methylation domain-containing protein
MKLIFPIKKALHKAGYSLAEVMVAISIIGIAIGACVGLTSTIILQEQLAWNGTVAINYQENMSRLWQLGIGANSAFSSEVLLIMPSVARNIDISEAVAGTPVAIPLSNETIGPSALGVVERARTTLTLQNLPTAGVGATSETQLIRPTIK